MTYTCCTTVGGEIFEKFEGERKDFGRNGRRRRSKISIFGGKKRKRARSRVPTACKDPTFDACL